MRSMKATFVALPVFVFLMGSPGYAQPVQPDSEPRRPAGFRPQRPQLPLFRELDRNSDGIISEQELQNAVSALKRLDRNRDRRITIDEMRPQSGGPQPGNRPQPANRSRSGGPGSRGSASLERAGLKVGSMLPDVDVYDAEGQVVSTASLRGSYTVLVFGCLT